MSMTLPISTIPIHLDFTGSSAPQYMVSGWCTFQHLPCHELLAAWGGGETQCRAGQLSWVEKLVQASMYTPEYAELVLGRGKAPQVPGVCEGNVQCPCNPGAHCLWGTVRRRRKSEGMGVRALPAVALQEPIQIGRVA